MITQNTGWSSISRQQASKEGSERYNNGSTDEKLNSQLGWGMIDEKLTSYNKINDALVNHKPLMFCSLGTTGLNNDGKDEIMQVCITRYTFNENEGKYEQVKKTTPDGKVKPDIFFVVPRISDAALAKALASKGKAYDIFAEGGFDRDIKDNGISVSTKDYCDRKYNPETPKKLAERINQIFKDNPDDLYVGLNNAFADKFFKPLGIEIPANSCDIIDFMKEWDIANKDARLNQNSTKYKLNEIVGQYDNLGLKCNNPEGKLFSTPNKVSAMKSVLLDIVPYILEKYQTKANKENPLEVKVVTNEVKKDVAQPTTPTQSTPTVDKQAEAEAKTATTIDKSLNTNAPALDNFDKQDFTAFENDAKKSEKVKDIPCYTNDQQSKETQDKVQTVEEYKKTNPKEVARIVEKEKRLDEILDKLVKILAEVQDLSKEQKNMNLRIEAVEQSLQKKPKTPKTPTVKTTEATKDTPVTPAKDTKEEDKTKETEVKDKPVARRGRPPKNPVAPVIATPVKEEPEDPDGREENDGSDEHDDR